MCASKSRRQLDILDHSQSPVLASTVVSVEDEKAEPSVVLEGSALSDSFGVGEGDDVGSISAAGPVAGGNQARDGSHEPTFDRP